MTGGSRTCDWDVFIAYPRAARAVATELYDALFAVGIRGFIDHRCVPPGDRWFAAIDGAQRASKLTAAVLTAGGDDAYYAQEEITRAIELHRRDPAGHLVVPIFVDSGIEAPYGLSSLQGVTLSEVGSMHDVAETLARLIRSGKAPRLPVAASRRSPFRPGVPLYVGDHMPGPSRRAFVATLDTDIRRRRANVNLVGERRMGKTSVLNHVWGRLVEDPRHLVVRVNMQEGLVCDEDFYGEVLRGTGASPQARQLFGTKRAADMQGASAATYAELRDVLRDIRDRVTVVLVVDEFERCFEFPDAFPSPVFYDNLRSLIGGDTFGPYLFAIVATREYLNEYFVRRQITSKLPTYLPPRPLSLLTDDDAEELLAQESPYRLGSAQREHAARMGGRHPCMLQCAGEAWFRALEANEGGERAREEFQMMSRQLCIGVGSSAS